MRPEKRGQGTGGEKKRDVAAATVYLALPRPRKEKISSVWSRGGGKEGKRTWVFGRKDLLLDVEKSNQRCRLAAPRRWGKGGTGGSSHNERFHLLKRDRRGRVWGTLAWRKERGVKEPGKRKPSDRSLTNSPFTRGAPSERADLGP